MQRLKRLSTSIFDDRAFAPGAVIAQGIATSLTWQDFLGQVERWKLRIGGIAGRHVAVQLTPVDEFLACLWACWRLQKTPVLSANAFRNLGSLLDTRLAIDLPSLAADDFISAISVPADAASDQQDAALTLYTSGSSGAPQQITKHFFQLEAELAALEQLWGDSVEGTVFASAVSHNHMFGLPFGVLWPLMRGTPFHTGSVQYPESIEGLARKHALTLIASPVQLDNLHAGLDWKLLSSRITQVFSAGAPLSLQTAEYCLRQLGRPVTEIYGSTETGAVAWRALPADTRWRCLPGVGVQYCGDGAQLRIASPAIGAMPFDMADRGTVHADGSFDLLGRADHIVKLGGKRVSLTAVEAALCSHAWVEQARTVQLAARKGRLGAVLVLNAAGNSQLVDAGKADLGNVLKKHIEPAFDRVALPRYWRFVSKLPMNTEGKVTQDALAALFANAGAPRFPEVLASEIRLQSAHQRLTLRIPEELYYFNGHFPGHPVLPGVVQIAWAMHYGKEQFEGLLDFSHLEAIKFQHVILPNARVYLDLQWHAELQKLVFAFSSDQTQHSSGRILFKSP